MWCGHSVAWFLSRQVRTSLQNVQSGEETLCVCECIWLPRCGGIGLYAPANNLHVMCMTTSEGVMWCCEHAWVAGATM